MKEKKAEILNEFNKLEFLKEEEIKDLNFEELATYLQWLNNVESLYNAIESGDQNGWGITITNKRTRFAIWKFI